MGLAARWDKSIVCRRETTSDLSVVPFTIIEAR